jgi:hypothetical protein
MRSNKRVMKKDKASREDHISRGKFSCRDIHKRNGTWPRAIIITILVILSAMIILLVYQTVISSGKLASTGWAFKEGDVISTPPLETVDLVAIKMIKWDFSKMKEEGLKVKTRLSASASKSGQLDELQAIAWEKEGLIYYEIKLGEESQRGYLSEKMQSTGELYLDTDEIGDLKLSYDPSLKVLEIANLNFVVPIFASSTAFDAQMKKISPEILHFSKNVSGVYHFNISSVPAAEVKKLVDGKEAAGVFSEAKKGDNYVLLNMSWKPVESRPYKLVLNATNAGKSTLIEYILAVDGKIYSLSLADLPKVNLNRTKDEAGKEYYEVQYDFSATEKVQPVSLLCGEAVLEKNTVFDNVAAAYSYEDSKVKQWKSGVPSEFTKLESGKGYALQLKKDATLSFKVKCDQLPSTSLGALKSGWNLIGINGYKEIPKSSLEGKIPVGKKISGLYEFDNSGSVKKEIEKMIPGRVYWIKVE